MNRDKLWFNGTKPRKPNAKRSRATERTQSAMRRESYAFLIRYDDATRIHESQSR
jgi:hypothetical protein